MGKVHPDHVVVIAISRPRPITRPASRGDRPPCPARRFGDQRLEWPLSSGTSPDDSEDERGGNLQQIRQRRVVL